MLAIQRPRLCRGLREPLHVTLSGGTLQLLHSATLSPNSAPLRSRCQKAPARIEKAQCMPARVTPRTEDARRGAGPSSACGCSWFCHLRPVEDPASPSVCLAAVATMHGTSRTSATSVNADCCIPAGLRLGPVPGTFKLGKYLSDRREPGPKKKVLGHSGSLSLASHLLFPRSRKRDTC